ncbi:unnamed protein product [Parnassius mnemosyne]|uniref:Reverse transcriptase RNase H-like domain-containing protein n=1 Tax=Parnassius mnemosyne TaxID=213953 RepID=A0AAV1K5U3_9NEOP
MLTQHQDDKEVVIAYMSKALKKNQQNYSTTERETLAVITALEHWRCYLDNGKEFTIYTDHAALKWFQNLLNPSGRLARWTLRLSCFNFVLKHKKGKDNVVPDLLSRHKNQERPDTREISPQGVHPITIEEPPDRKLEHYNKIFLGCSNKPNSYPNYTIRDNKLYRCIHSPDRLNDDFIWKEVPLPQDRHAIIEVNHGSPSELHLGIFKTFKKISLVNPTEKFNSTIITALASLVGDDHRSWDNHLTKIQYAMNSATNVATGFTPNFLVFGRETIPSILQLRTSRN